MPIKIIDAPQETREELKHIATYVVSKINEVAVKEAHYLTLQLEIEDQQGAFLHLLDYCYYKILTETINLILQTALELHHDRMETHTQK